MYTIKQTIITGYKYKEVNYLYKDRKKDMTEMYMCTCKKV